MLILQPAAAPATAAARPARRLRRRLLPPPLLCCCPSCPPPAPRGCRCSRPAPEGERHTSCDCGQPKRSRRRPAAAARTARPPQTLRKGGHQCRSPLPSPPPHACLVDGQPLRNTVGVVVVAAQRQHAHNILRLKLHAEEGGRGGRGVRVRGKLAWLRLPSLRTSMRYAGRREKGSVRQEREGGARRGAHAPRRRRKHSEKCNTLNLCMNWRCNTYATCKAPLALAGAMHASCGSTRQCLCWPHPRTGRWGTAPRRPQWCPPPRGTPAPGDQAAAERHQQGRP